MGLYLVTGGCGFIGSHLCDALLAHGHAVRVLDDLSTGTMANLAAGATFVRGSVTDHAEMRRVMAEVDGCFHLAAIASVQRCMMDWSGTHQVNLGGAIAVFEAAASQQTEAHRIPVVYASSAAVYGNCATLPIPEDAAKRPESAYGADKYGCELHAAIATGVHAIPTTGLRFFNVYGPRQDPASPYSGVISIFASRIQSGRAFDVFGDGSQTRDFVAVSDVVTALIQAMMQPAPAARVFNVCTGRPTSVLDLATLLGSLCAKTPQPRFAAPRLGEIKHSIGSTQAVLAGLGWSARTTLEDGLRATLDWMPAP